MLGRSGKNTYPWILLLILFDCRVKYPQASVPKYWPKDLDGSIALNGKKAKAPAPTMQFEALKPSGLVSRTVTLPTQEKPQIQVLDEPKSIVVKDTTSAYPPGTVQGKKLSTWNARIISF